jgi:hypothetical protein
MRASPGLLAVRAEAADEDSLRRIQDPLAAGLQKFGRRERLMVTWRRPGAAAAEPETEARAAVRSEDFRPNGRELTRPGAGWFLNGDVPRAG